ncbi:hypothetical protein ACWGBH_06375 [Streptomyces massasporeus]
MLPTAYSVPVRDLGSEEGALIGFLRHCALQGCNRRWIAHGVGVRVGTVTGVDRCHIGGELLEHFRTRAVVAVRKVRIDG